MVLFVKQYLSTHLIKFNVFAQNLPFQKVSGFVFSICRPRVSSNLTIFFEELTKVLSKAVLKYQNIIPLDETHLDAVMGLI